MKISIIVPLYNKRPYVRQTLDSIARQSFRDWEAIVVDDGSTDGGAEIVAAYPDPRFRLIRQANAGPGAARNRALAEARGVFAAFLDADDRWLPEYLETTLAVLDCRDAAPSAVSCGYVEYPKGISREPMWRKRGIREGVQSVTANLPGMQLSYLLAYMSSWSTVARAETVRRWGGFHEQGCRFGEDAVLWLKVLLNEPVHFLLRPLALFNRGASALSANLGGPRPLEPFLTNPEEVRSCCPPALTGALERLLAVRACKAAAMLGYWGQWRQARDVRDAFASWKDWRLPYFWAAAMAATPMGAWTGGAWRALARLRNRLLQSVPETGRRGG
jgi:hypothetical protein